MNKRFAGWFPYAFLLIIGACMYVPVITGLFFLKNDAAVAYFPVRLQMSQAVHHGIIPFWSPYFNYGYPLHADFTSGFWNPLVWLFISLFHYSFYTLHLEWMGYVWIAAWGMFRLGRLFGFSRLTACTVAIAYVGSGYWLGSAQWMNWLSPVAWLPYLIAQAILLFKTRHISHALWLAVVLWCFVSNAHPDQIIWLIYFTVISLIGSAMFYSKRWQDDFLNEAKGLQFVKLLLVTGVCAGLLLAGLILSIYTAIPYMYRSKALSMSQIGHPFSVSCWVSFLFPLVTTSPDIGWDQTDMVLRNAYIGSILFICAIGFFLSMRKLPAARFWFMQGICFLILSAGWLQHVPMHLPLLAYVRLQSAWRLGAVLAFCISGGYFLHLIEQNISYQKIFLRVSVVLFVIYLIVAIACFPSVIHLLSGIRDLWKGFHRVAFKQWMEDINLKDKFFIESITGVFITGILLIVLRKTKSPQKWIRTICMFIILDIFIHVQWMMPYTVVGKSSVKQVEQITKVFPDDYPIPPLIPVRQYDTFPASISRMIGSKSYYDKRIGSPDYPNFYPNLLTSVRLFYQSGYASCADRTPYVFLSQKIYPPADLSKACRELDSSAIFLSQSVGKFSLPDSSHLPAHLKVDTFLPGLMRLSVFNSSNVMLLCKQNDYPYWKVYDNGKNMSVYRANISFMAVYLPAGNHAIEFRYDPGIIRICFWLMWCTWIIISTIAWLSRKISTH
ncbi:glycosyltransferase family protein [Thermoflavifilum thermophilum]|uniref:Membrane protein YfhO n=1 Tax=Thermoflavifilum thermophilum TaxID=1393122 RepID=A0A1I7NFH1_9BACT|nr:hypothetical protein [Thermoflavifilum thermophilum]SFV33414.1 hypothetical protein SAMN05660895_1687 [Thermoflavifilum thermophilum]